MLADSLLATLSLQTTYHSITAVCVGILAIYLTLVVIHQTCQYINYRLSKYPPKNGILNGHLGAFVNSLWLSIGWTIEQVKIHPRLKNGFRMLAKLEH
jgi:hypothetical protein